MAEHVCPCCGRRFSEELGVFRDKVSESEAAKILGEVMGVDSMGDKMKDIPLCKWNLFADRMAGILLEVMLEKAEGAGR